MDTQNEQLHIEYENKKYKIGSISNIKSSKHPSNDNSFLIAFSRLKTLAILECIFEDSNIRIISSYSTNLSENISNLAFDSEGKYIFVATRDKKISIYPSTNLNELLYTRDAPKKIIKLIIDNSNLIFGDKFGMMYQHELVESDGKITLSEPTVPLGHYATIIDFIITPKSKDLDTRLMITADKDQRIRCSYWPDAFNIHSFFLGHSEFVTSLCLIESSLFNKFYLVSGAGDGTLILWDIEASKNIQSISLSSNLDSSNSCVKLRADNKLKRITVSNIVYIEPANMLCVIVELYKGFLLYKLDVTNNEPRLTYYKTVQTSFAPLSVCYLKDQNLLWIGGVEIDEQIPLAIYNINEQAVEVESNIANCIDSLVSSISESEVNSYLQQSLLERLYQKNAHQLNFSEPKKKKVTE